MSQRRDLEAVLYPRGELQIFLDCLLAFVKLLVGGAECFFGSNPFGDIREGHDRKPGAGILECSGTDDDWQTTAALARQNKGIAVVAGPELDLDLLGNKIPFL